MHSILDLNQSVIFYINYLIFLVMRYFIFAGIPFLYLHKNKAERFLKYKLSSNKIKSKQIYREIKYSLFSTVLFAFGGLYCYLLNNHKSGLFYENIQEYGWIYWLFSIFIIFLINDIWFYFTHRLLHIYPKLYRFHHIHHQSIDTNPLTSFSFHPVEAMINVAFIFLLPWILPLHLSAFGVFAIGSFLYNVYGHCGFDWYNREKFNNSIWSHLMSSRNHQWHHGKVNGNYGLYFSFLDRFFKTYHP